MSRTIVIANQKGGVGKTTTAVNLGAALAKLGPRVLLVDLDPQGALTVSLGLDPYTIKPSTYDLLLVPETPVASLLHTLAPRLDCLPANAELVAAEYKLLKEPDRILKLRKALPPVAALYDFILIDTPPSLGLLTINGLVAAQELLIPVATDYLAMRGVRALLESVWLIRDKVNPDLQLLGLVPTLYKADSPHSAAVVAEMRKVFKRKVSHTVIPMDEAASAAPAARQAIVDFSPQSKAAVAYMRLAEEVRNVE